MKLPLAIILAFVSISSGGTPWELAVPGWQYRFPRDHEMHPGFKTEWWYFTGNLTTQGGARLGYQATFFRNGIRPPASRGETTSRFIVDDLKFAHFAVSDSGAGQFRFFQRSSRGAYGEAGFGRGGESVAWIEDWKLKRSGGDGWALELKAEGTAIALEVNSVKPLVIHGTNGVSQKADGKGHASHYYSATRLNTTGKVWLGDRVQDVKGNSWFDHEWGSNQLAADQVGWDWLSVALNDGTELMLYRLRLRDGTVDQNSSGTFVEADGRSRHLTKGDYKFSPTRWWKSAATGGRYPVAWEVEVPAVGLRLAVETPMRNQELVLTPIAYWEGMIDAGGERNGAKVRGDGYLELTGYSGPIVGLKQ